MTAKDAAELDVRIRLEPQPQQPPIEPRSPPTTIWAALDTRVFARAHTGLLGPRAGAQLPLNRWLVLDADLGAIWGRAIDPLGEVSETLATAGASLRATHASRALSWGVGPRAEGGVAWLHGEPGASTTIGSNATSAILFLGLSAAASFRVERSIAGVVAIDAGETAYGFGARAASGGDERHVSDLLGPFIGARLGLGWAVDAGVVR